MDAEDRKVLSQVSSVAVTVGVGIVFAGACLGLAVRAFTVVAGL